MSENRTEVLIGAAVLAVAVGFGAYVFQSTGTSLGISDQYEVTASFRSAEGITIGTDVRLAGVKIGTVSDLNLNPTSFRADAILSIDNDIPLPDDTSLAISSEGLLGGNFVEVYPGASFDNLAAGDEIVDTQGSVSLVTLLMKFVGGDQ